jgi:hypothetical protein
MGAGGQLVTGPGTGMTGTGHGTVITGSPCYHYFYYYKACISAQKACNLKYPYSQKHKQPKK